MRSSPLYLCLAASLLLSASAAASPTVRGAKASRKATKPAPAPTIVLQHLTTHDSYQLRADSPRGGFSRKKLRQMSELLRCHHTGKRHSISERLIEILYATARHYHNAKLYIVAGYRAPQIARQKGNPRSPHKRGVACDFQVAGVTNEEVRDYLKQTYHKIGVGYYPRSGFVHLDVGRSRDAYWIDYSGPGEPARYGKAAPAEAVGSGEQHPSASPAEPAPIQDAAHNPSPPADPEAGPEAS